MIDRKVLDSTKPVELRWMVPGDSKLGKGGKQDKIKSKLNTNEIGITFAWKTDVTNKEEKFFISKTKRLVRRRIFTRSGVPDGL